MTVVSTALRRSRSWVRGSAVMAFGGAAAVIFVNDNLIEIGSIEGVSMAPTLSPDYGLTGRRDFVIWRKWDPLADLQRGDVIQFGSLKNPEDTAVKRVIATAGDTVLLDPKRRPERKDGQELVETKNWDRWQGRASVQQGHLWVEGDNVGHSGDSNGHGPISQALVTGRAIAIFTPWDRFGLQPWRGYKSKTRVIKGNVAEVDNGEDYAAVWKSIGPV